MKDGRFHEDSTPIHQTDRMMKIGEIVEERVGTACEIPGSPRGQEVYYKVFETKRVEIRPFVIYWRENAFEPWQTFEAAADVKTIRIRLEAVRVDA